MKTIPFKGVNVIVGKEQAEYKQIPAHYQDGYMTCLAKFSWRERIRILFSGRLWVIHVTSGLPLQPFNLTTESPLNIETDSEKKEEKTEKNHD